MSENTSQGQQQGSTTQGAPSQLQAGQHQELQHEQTPVDESQVSPDNPARDPGKQVESGQQPWQGQGRAAQNYQPDSQPAEREHEYRYAERGEQPRDTHGEYVKADEVDKLIAEKLAERDRQHEAEIAKVRNLVPVAMVPMNAGGPGNDNHRPSWSLAEQEAAARGDDLDHWHDE